MSSLYDEIAREKYDEECRKREAALAAAGSPTPETDRLDPEVQSAVAELNEMMKGKLPCGHTIGDLIGGKDAITQCGACLAKRQRR